MRNESFIGFVCSGRHSFVPECLSIRLSWRYLFRSVIL